jgi:hypothetical protein
MILGASIQLKDQFSSTMTKLHKETNTITSKIKILGNMTVRPVIAITDKATKAIGKIKDNLLSLKGLAATALTGLGVGKVVGAGMMLEQQQISMQHFIGIQNKGMDATEIKKQADEYINWLRSYADITPFATNEIIGGGARGINVAGGDIALAKELVKLAGDMAALNPEKTFSDAMEALADLRTGETERMKEFGFKITQEDIKKAGGVEAVIKNQIQPFFEGGADKLSESAAGLWSTITGGLGTTVTTVSEGILGGLKPQLQGLVTWMGDNKETISAWATNFGRGLGNAIQTVSGFVSRYMPIIKDGIASVMDWLGPKIDFVKDKIPFLQSAWETAWPTISSVLQTAWSIASPILNTIGSVIQIIWSIFEAAWPSIVKVVETAWAILKPIFDAIAGGLGIISKGFKWVATKLGAEPQEVVVEGTEGKSHASGLPYVPYDNYPALLHRGERVLTAADNRQYNTGARTAPPNITIIIQGADKSPREIAKEVAKELYNELKEADMNMPATPVII